MKREVKDIDDRVKKGERWMIGLTSAIALSALCSVVVGGLQWSTMMGQLSEMKSGGSDTHNLAVAAGNQAIAASGQAGSMQLLADRMKEQAERTKDLADQARISAATAKSQLEAIDRPWLKVKLVPSEVTFHEGGIQFGLRAEVTNIGHAVATGGHSTHSHVLGCRH